MMMHHRQGVPKCKSQNFQLAVSQNWLLYQTKSLQKELGFFPTPSCIYGYQSHAQAPNSNLSLSDESDKHNLLPNILLQLTPAKQSYIPENPNRYKQLPFIKLFHLLASLLPTNLHPTVRSNLCFPLLKKLLRKYPLRLRTDGDSLSFNEQPKYSSIQIINQNT